MPDYTKSYSLGLQHPWVYQNVGGAWVLWNKHTKEIRSIRSTEWDIGRLAALANVVEHFDPFQLDSVP